jgi:hypothetical protein
MRMRSKELNKRKYNKMSWIETTYLGGVICLYLQSINSCLCTTQTLILVNIYNYLFKNTSQERNKRQNGLRPTIHVIKVEIIVNR